MIWSRRLFYAIALTLALAPLLLSSRLARPIPAAATERAGLTLGTDQKRHIIVTSLRAGGPADLGGIAVGDELRDIGGQHITTLAMARRLIDDPVHCDLLVDVQRPGLVHVARMKQCAEKGQ